MKGTASLRARRFWLGDLLNLQWQRLGEYGRLDRADRIDIQQRLREIRRGVVDEAVWQVFRRDSIRRGAAARKVARRRNPSVWHQGERVRTTGAGITAIGFPGHEGIIVPWKEGEPTIPFDRDLARCGFVACVDFGGYILAVRNEEIERVEERA